MGIQLVHRILYKNYKLIIVFKERMKENTVHSYLNIGNYQYVIKGKGFFFDRNKTKIQKLNNMSVMFIFQEDSLDFTIIEGIKIGYKYYVSVPYCESKYLKKSEVINEKICYVEDIKGNIQEIDKVTVLEKSSNIDLNKCMGEITDLKTIAIKNNSKSFFRNIKLDDFYFYRDDVKYNPIKWKQNNNGVLFLIFEENLFNNSGDFIELKVVSTPESQDIFGDKILGNSLLEIQCSISTKIDRVSYVNYTTEKIILRIRFTEALAIFNPKDFVVIINKRKYYISKWEYDLGKESVKIQINVIVDNEMPLCIKVKTIDEIDMITTYDIKGRKIVNSQWNLLDMFRSTNFIIENINDNFLGTSIIMEYNSKLDSTTLSDQWNGDQIELLPGEVCIEKESENKAILRFEQINIGVIELFSYEGESILGDKSIVYNKENVNVSFQENKLLVKFSYKENLQINSQAIYYFIYKQSEYIRSYRETSIFVGYNPVFFQIRMKTIIVPPLMNAEDNPFTGGIKDANYILYLSSDQKYNIYGVKGRKTTIKGFVKIIEESVNTEKVTLNNLEIEKDILIEEMESSLEFDLVKGKRVLVE